LKAKTPQKKFIKSSVTLHDRSQIETVFDYYLNRLPKKSVTKKKFSERFFPNRALRYRVETYFFFPKQFGINPATYSKEEFYKDIRPLVRFKEPKLGYKQLIGLPVKGHAPLSFLRLFLHDFAAGRLTSRLEVPIAELRIFACSFVSFFFTGIDRRYKKTRKLKALCTVNTIEAAAEISKSYTRATRLLQKSAHILREYRELLEEERACKDLPDVLKKEFSIVNEYCHYRFRDGLARLLVMYEGIAEHTEEAVRFRELIAKLAAEAKAYGALQGYVEINAETSLQTKEHYMHRRGQLKRRIWSVLFLEIRTQQLFTFQRHFGAMLAAGMAALWALGAQIMVIRKLSGAEDLSSFWDVSGFLFMTAVILAYVVKDRIKELGRGYFRGWIFRRLPDNSEAIFYANSEGADTGAGKNRFGGGDNRRLVIGKMTEAAQFLPHSQLPKDIAELRKRSNEEVMGVTVRNDEILLYAKEITLRGNVRTLNRYPLRAVHDILRFNIDGCLPRLAEPTRSGHVVDDEAGIYDVNLPKVYYLDLAIKYIKLGRGRVSERMAIDYLRLVMNKKGLIRIEKLS
jgi:hypothetical protein